MSEWLEWHRGYDSGAGLPGRLREVQEQIRCALDRCPGGPVSVISVCAGDGRDLLGVLPWHSRRDDVRARLVELGPELVARGRALAADRGCPVEFVLGDASTTSAYAGAVPADVVLVCGVFGYITDGDVRGTIAHLPELCAPEATVIWTRPVRARPDAVDPPVVRRSRLHRGGLRRHPGEHAIRGGAPPDHRPPPVPAGSTPLQLPGEG